MTDADKLRMLKVDLGITATAYDERLGEYLTYARAEIQREGITLTEDTAETTETMDDANLQVMYAAWLWRKRDSGEGMPRMLRWALNNRLFDLGK